MRGGTTRQWAVHLAALPGIAGCVSIRKPVAIVPSGDATAPGLRQYL